MLTLALLLTPPVLQAPPPNPGPAPRLWDRHARELGLSEAQKGQFTAIHEAHRASMEAKGKAVHEAQAALMDCVRGGQGDLNALHQAYAERHLAMLTEQKAMHAEIFGILTPEQQAKAKTLMPRGPMGPMGHGSRHGGHRGF